ncbi:MAG: alpha/beta hydrolase [Bacteroidetes bacterium]|jgi:Predicted hydrolases or acyltransferases (alpha/beta hydrolase superfamily)|uniref:alpha/beta fold hydrolase n=1 Tax=Phnomibacter sp. TaxID=2836217 RepID=UPI002FDDB6D7|nr:alpha/beta hydrolase [Bacteroidota bacterium]
MKSKALIVNGIRLHYLDNDLIHRPALVFIHGNSQSVSAWMFQLNNPALNAFRLIAFDLPSHGASEASLQPDIDYTLIGIGKLMADAVMQLQLDKFILGGLSLGTNFVIEMLNHLSPNAIFLFGSSFTGDKRGLSDIMLESVDATCLFTDEVDIGAFEKFLNEVFKGHPASFKKMVLKDYVGVKSPFRSLILKSYLAGQFSDGFVQLRNFKGVVLVVFGEEESIVNPHYLNDIECNRFQGEVMLVKDANHFVNIDQPAIVNDVLLRFAKQVLIDN